MTAGPGGRGGADATGHGRLRASDADREQVIDTLKTAFVQGWLSRDQLGVRAGQALVSRTYAELAAVTDGIPARLTGVGEPPALAVGHAGPHGLQLRPRGRGRDRVAYFTTYGRAWTT